MSNCSGTQNLSKWVTKGLCPRNLSLGNHELSCRSSFLSMSRSGHTLPDTTTSVADDFRFSMIVGYR